VGAIVNASPIIYLARAGLLDLLRLVGDVIRVPSPVADEILARGESDPAAASIKTTAWLEIVDTPAPSLELLAWDLGVGESAVIAYAMANAGFIAVVDDLTGRRCAEAFGIPLRGTLGLVLRAKKVGVVSDARQTIERLRAAGMYLSDQTMNRALLEVGE
jgi:predicted nucleic acid-binding protein